MVPWEAGEARAAADSTAMMVVEEEVAREEAEADTTPPRRREEKRERYATKASRKRVRPNISFVVAVAVAVVVVLVIWGGWIFFFADGILFVVFAKEIILSREKKKSMSSTVRLFRGPKHASYPTFPTSSPLQTLEKNNSIASIRSIVPGR